MTPPHPLTTDEIIEATRLHTSELVAQVWDIAWRQVQCELDRQKILDGKAMALLQAVGLSVTVAVSFGCQVLLKDARPFAQMGAPHAVVLVAAVAASVTCGLLAGLFAHRALGIKSYQRLTERGVFDLAELRDADALLDGSPVAQYQRYLLPRVWEMAQTHAGIHDKKAETILTGQRLFLGFLCTLIAVGLLIAGRVWITSTP